MTKYIPIGGERVDELKKDLKETARVYREVGAGAYYEARKGNPHIDVGSVVDSIHDFLDNLAVEDIRFLQKIDSYNFGQVLYIAKRKGHTFITVNETMYDLPGS